MALWDFGEPGDGLAPWQDHEAAAARLCARAYIDTPGIRAFAPHDTPDEWMEYITQLRKGPGCGWFAPEFSLVVPAATDGELDAAILITDLGPGTVHVAQLAVDPAARGRGLARRLVRAALGRAARLYDRATLLVSATNTPAVSLYDSIGFEDLATFLVAVKRQPTLSKSVAVATGGESTRR
jgi:ribosomal protein S18 acetylase RimI-like enzyme